MTIIEQLDRIRDWTGETICSQVQLKLPNDDAVDDMYEYKLVTPAAFSLYFPGKERLPPTVAAPIPSICVQLLEGDSSAQKARSQLKLRYVFSAWNPGPHGPDSLGVANTVTERYILPGQPAPTEPNAHNPTQPSGEFIRMSEGWRDVWNFVDVAIRELESTNIINGIRIVREEPIKFGPVTEQDAIVDFYPYWYAWASFTVETSVVRNNKTYQDLL